jgi:hypothetical protein
MSQLTKTEMPIPAASGITMARSPIRIIRIEEPIK